jgi:hypothetical protein
MTTTRDIGQVCLDSVRARFAAEERAAERAVDQLDPADVFAVLDPESNSVALIMKHVGGNLRSRWTDFLTSDGEKADRRRDDEFVVEPGETLRAIRERWEQGWACLHETLARLGPDDLLRMVRIRDERLTAIDAINRSLAHTAGHVGQIVLLARHLRGTRWQTLSVPRGQSEAFNEAWRRKQAGQG